MVVLASTIVLLLAVACRTGGGQAGGGSSSDGGSDGSTYPAFSPTDVPRIVTAGGPVIASPKIVPVFFASDSDTTMTNALADFALKVGQTQYWAMSVKDYGVGAATGAPAVRMAPADNPPSTLSDAEIEQWFAAKLDDSASPLPAPDASTVYLLFYPQGVTVTKGSAQSCVDFAAYHSSVALSDGSRSAYAVVPRCASLFNLTGLDAITAAASHELIESVTDPSINDIVGDAGSDAGAEAGASDARAPEAGASDARAPESGASDARAPESGASDARAPESGASDANASEAGASDASATLGFFDFDLSHRYWAALFGGELCDYCARNPSSFAKFPDFAYTVQRCWSNARALFGQDPCVPPPADEVYFNTIPVMNDLVHVDLRVGPVTYQGVHIPVGGSTTVELDLFSLGAMAGPWTVQAADIQAMNGNAALLAFAFDKTEGSNGDRILMTITVLAAGPGNVEPFVITSTLACDACAGGARQTEWAGVVGN
jgi:hypothetical protein